MMEKTHSCDATKQFNRRICTRINPNTPMDNLIPKRFMIVNYDSKVEL